RANSFKAMILTSKNFSLATVRKSPLISVVIALAAVAWAVLFAFGVAGYSGSKTVYVLLSVVSSAMLVDGLRQSGSYGYLFMTGFLWLGFWFKLTIHTVLSYPFIEPVGTFVGGGAAWDEVLWVAILACVGAMLGRVIYGGWGRRRRVNEMPEPVVPRWYEPYRGLIWAALGLLAAAVIVANMRYGIHLIGLAPRTSLMWPLNSVIAWLLNIGLATGIAVLLWWDITLKKNVTFPLYAVIVEGLITSVSIMSRAAYVFHVIPQLMVAYRLRRTFVRWSGARTVVLGVVAVLVLMVSISAVTTFRNYLYQSGVYSSTAYQVAYSRWEVLSGAIGALEVRLRTATPQERVEILALIAKYRAERELLKGKLDEERGKWEEAIKSGSAQSLILINEFGYQITNGVMTRILYLSVDRWIGLEGLMAVQSYPEKSLDLMTRALREIPEAGKPDVYQSVANSVYLKSDGTKFRFASLPGGAAFLYYSGSYIIVLLGMAAFTVILLGVESAIGALTRNPILCSLYGVVAANSVTQFGVTPRQSLPYFTMLACGILLVWLVQTRAFGKLIPLKSVQTKSAVEPGIER
ncbi:MAG: hypothetical protein Q7T70_12710, partial [Polaromonas sp.]|nr:hypothetical protein [Polaromonas sp.]